MLEWLTAFGDFWRRRPARVTPARKILFVTTYCPTRSHAGGLRLLDLCSRIRKIAPGAAIDVFAFRNAAIDGDYSDVEAMFDAVLYCDRMRLNYARFLKARPPRKDYDVVSFEYLQAPSVIRSFLPHAGKALFTPMELLTRGHALPQLQNAPEARATRLIRRDLQWEAEVSRLVDEVVCVSEPDAQTARRLRMNPRVSCLETGLSELEFGAAATDAPREPFTVLFLAFFGSQTNRDALRWYLDGPHVLLKNRFPGYRLDVVGRGDLRAFVDEADGALNLIGEVERIGPFIARAAVGIAPALSGAGFRGKINQYAWLGTPCVASPLAAEGLAYRPPHAIMVADSPPAFAEAVAALLESPSLRAAVGENARRICADRYSWSTRDPDIARIFDLA